MKDKDIARQLGKKSSQIAPLADWHWHASTMTCADITPKQRWRFFRRIRTKHVRGQTPAKSHVSTCSEHVLFETQTPCRSCRWYRIGRAGNAAKRRRWLACLLARSLATSLLSFLSLPSLGPYLATIMLPPLRAVLLFFLISFLRNRQVESMPRR
jgi:hypothetical protein